MMGAGSNSTGRRRGKRRSAPMNDMNVAPLVDVMLVLLIVFMVTAPLLTVGVPITLKLSINKEDFSILILLQIIICRLSGPGPGT